LYYHDPIVNYKMPYDFKLLTKIQKLTFSSILFVALWIVGA